MAKLRDCKLEFVRDDDYVEYFVFPQLPEHISVDDEDAVRRHLQAVREQCDGVVRSWVDKLQYIWHKDEFQLRVRTGSQQEALLNEEHNNTEVASMPPHLHGVTHYGDNIEDEWFIVHLLYQVTAAIPQCVARVVDSDGEFMMIEAAMVLPKWANPDTCEQRVYIADGALHLIQNSPSNTAQLMPVPRALEKLRQDAALYRVGKEIQSCIAGRIDQFREPQEQHKFLHHQIVRLPVGVAGLLKRKPGLIAPAVHAFCERDHQDLKVCRTMRHFPPEQRVRTNVRFTRTLYAMLMHAAYTPDRKIGWNLSGDTNSESYKEELLGVKVACGFEILVSRAKSLKEDVENEPAWRSYVRSLKAKGYFRDQLEGSAEYQRLWTTAKGYYKENATRFRTAPLVGNDVVQLLQDIDENVNELVRDEENNLRPSDPDDFLNITMEELDAMLMKRFTPKSLIGGDGDLNASEFTKNLAEFLEKESEYDGIHDSDDEDDVDSDDVASDDSKGDDGNDEEEEESAAGRRRAAQFNAKVRKNRSMRRACLDKPIVPLKKEKEGKSPTASASGAASQPSRQSSAKGPTPGMGGGDDNHIQHLLDFVIPEFKWDSNSDMSDYEDEDDLERNFEAMASAERNIDIDIKEYMAQMDRELARTTIGKSFESGSGAAAAAPRSVDDDDFDDIETFKPIDINVNTLKNMMDSYKSQIGGSGPATNLLSAMGVGMSAAAASMGDSKDGKSKDLSESTV